GRGAMPGREAGAPPHRLARKQSATRHDHQAERSCRTPPRRRAAIRSGCSALPARAGPWEPGTMHAYVRDIMTTGVVTVRPVTPYREVAAMFRQHRVSGFPVTGDDGKVSGVVSETDLLALAAGQHRPAQRSGGQATAGDLMSHPAVTISPDDLVKTAAGMMHKHRIQRLPVVDPGGRLVGIVSRSDVLSVFDRSDEEIRREVTQD